MFKEAQYPSVFFGRLFSPRASSETFVEAVGKDLKVSADEDLIVEGSLLGRPTLTNEALLAEASRYPVSHSYSLFSLGFWGDFSSSPFLGPDEAFRVRERASSGLEGSKAAD